MTVIFIEFVFLQVAAYSEVAYILNFFVFVRDIFHKSMFATARGVHESFLKGLGKYRTDYSF